MRGRREWSVGEPLVDRNRVGEEQLDIHNGAVWKSSDGVDRLACFGCLEGRFAHKRMQDISSVECSKDMDFWFSSCTLRRMSAIRFLCMVMFAFVESILRLRRGRLNGALTEWRGKSVGGR